MSHVGTASYDIQHVSGGESHVATRWKRAVILPPPTPEDIEVSRNQPRREPTDSQRQGHDVSREKGIPLGHSIGAVQFALGVHRFNLHPQVDPLGTLSTMDASERPLATKATIPAVVATVKMATEPTGAQMPRPWYVK